MSGAEGEASTCKACVCCSTSPLMPSCSCCSTCSCCCTCCSTCLLCSSRSGMPASSCSASLLLACTATCHEFAILILVGCLFPAYKSWASTASLLPLKPSYSDDAYLSFQGQGGDARLVACFRLPNRCSTGSSSWCSSCLPCFSKSNSQPPAAHHSLLPDDIGNLHHEMMTWCAAYRKSTCHHALLVVSLNFHKQCKQGSNKLRDE